MESTVESPNIFDIIEIVYLIHEHFTDLCPINVIGLSIWLSFGLVCKSFRALQVQMLQKESRRYDSNNSRLMRLTADEREIVPQLIVRSVQLFQQYKEYPITIHIQGCNPIVVDSVRRLKGDSKAELIARNGDSSVSSYLPYAPHYPNLFDFVRQISVEASRKKQECFCLFHFRRGYFGFIIQCKIDSVSKTTCTKQSVRLVKVYQTPSVRYYGQVQQEANKYPSTYSAALYYLLKDCVKYNVFYVSLSSTKRKRDTRDDDEEEREPKRAKNDHLFYSWKLNDSNLERHPIVLTVSREEELKEAQDYQIESDNPVQCNCSLL